MHLLIALQKNPRKKEFIKKINHLINNFEKLKNITGKKSKQKTASYVKQAVINLIDTELTEEQLSLLNLGPHFVPATKRTPFMDIISATETCALDFQNSSKKTDVEFLPQKVSHILKRNINIKLRGNLSKTQRKALIQIKSDKDTTFIHSIRVQGLQYCPKKCYAKNKLKNS